MNQKLSDWASIAEIFGGIAIVISLVFVGIQIKGNTGATQAATFQQHMGYEIEFLQRTSENPELGAAFWRFNGAKTSEELEAVSAELGPERLGQAQGMFLSQIRIFEDVFLQHRAGSFSEDGWNAREPLVRSIALHPIFHDMDRVSVTVSGPFAEYIIRIRAEEGL